MILWYRVSGNRVHRAGVGVYGFGFSDASDPSLVDILQGI